MRVLIRNQSELSRLFQSFSVSVHFACYSIVSLVASPLAPALFSLTEAVQPYDRVPVPHLC